ncbi:HD domain-containing protein [soil metagenome]
MTAPAIDALLALYRRWGGDPYDEELSQLAHAEQTAALATAASAPDELVIAALVHDVGHLLDLAAGDEGRAATADLRHEVTGSDHLAALFPPAVTVPVALHVQAKRYLCATDAGYAGRLSAGSQRSLRHQGGPMDLEEVTAFEATDGWHDAVLLRRWDDKGKVRGLAVEPLAHYRDLLVAVALPEIA